VDLHYNKRHADIIPETFSPLTGPLFGISNAQPSG